MKRIVATAFCALLFVAALSTATIAADATTPVAKRSFATEAEAIKGCGSDTVVWINHKTGVYHLKEARWYGKTKDGAFACRNEMDLSGFHAAKTIMPPKP